MIYGKGMLKGKILKIWYADDLFQLKVERIYKRFTTKEAMDNYLSYILKMVKDPQKTALLKQDLENYF